MDKIVVASSSAPAAIGPYSQAISVPASARMLYTSGQIGLDPKSGAMVEGGVEAEAKQVLANLEAVLVAGGSRLSSVVRTTIFLVDMNDFQKVNAIYGEAFKSAPPARATVAVAALPKGARVEIDAVAMVVE
ncbi:MAG: Rid family detoxifying hydrolase [Myxococcota bacterium]